MFQNLLQNILKIKYANMKNQANLKYSSDPKDIFKSAKEKKEKINSLKLP